MSATSSEISEIYRKFWNFGFPSPRNGKYREIAPVGNMEIKIQAYWDKGLNSTS